MIFNLNEQLSLKYRKKFDAVTAGIYILTISTISLFIYLIKNANSPLFPDAAYFGVNVADLIEFFKGKMTWSQVLSLNGDRILIFQSIVALLSFLIHKSTVFDFRLIYYFVFFPIYLGSLYSLISLFHSRKKSIFFALIVFLSSGSLLDNGQGFFSDLPSIGLFGFGLYYIFKILTNKYDINHKNTNLYFYFGSIILFISFLIHWQTTLIQGSISALIFFLAVQKRCIFSNLRKITRFTIFSTTLTIFAISYIYQIWRPFTFYIKYIPDWKNSWWQYGNSGIEISINHIYIFRIFSNLSLMIVPFISVITIIILTSLINRNICKTLLLLFLLLFLSNIWILEPINERYTLRIVFGFVGILIPNLEHSNYVNKIVPILLTLVLIPGIVNFQGRISQNTLSRVAQFFLSPDEVKYIPSLGVTNWTIDKSFNALIAKKGTNVYQKYFEAIVNRSNSSKNNLAVIDPNNKTGWGGYKAGQFALWGGRAGNLDYSQLYESNFNITGTWPGEMRISRVREEVEQSNVSGLLSADFLILPIGTSNQYINFERYNDPNPIVLPFETKVLKNAETYSFLSEISENKENNFSSKLYEIKKKSSWKKYIVGLYCSPGISNSVSAQLEYCKNSFNNLEFKSKKEFKADIDRYFNVRKVEVAEISEKTILRIAPFAPLANPYIHLHFVPFKSSFLSRCTFFPIDRNYANSINGLIYVNIDKSKLQDNCSYYVRILGNEMLR